MEHRYPWMTPLETAERLGIELADVWRWQADGRLVLDRTRPAGRWLREATEAEDGDPSRSQSARAGGSADDRPAHGSPVLEDSAERIRTWWN